MYLCTMINIMFFLEVKTLLYVIADDLTGASDTGVQLAKQGYNTTVFIINELSSLEKRQIEGTNIAVIDTETRDVHSQTARVILRRILTQLQIAKEDIVYKKIDSTLRGNVGAEIEEIMKILKKDICIFTPSFSSNNRISVGGYLLVKDELLGFSEYYKGGLEPGEASYIPSILREQTQLPIGLIDLKDIFKGHKTISEKIETLYREGKKIIVSDAVNHNNLKEILMGARCFKGSVLFCGSAGLAKYISEIIEEERIPKPSFNENGEPILIVGGTRSHSILSQIKTLKEREPVFDMTIDVHKILLNDKDQREKYALEAVRRIKENYITIIRPDPAFNNKTIIHNLLCEHSLSFRELEILIRDYLSLILREIMDMSPVKNLILSGGDTAMGVCSSLKIRKLHIIDEMLPGIPALLVSSEKYQQLQIITKAGGFGDKDTFSKLVKKIRGET